ncbi:Gfo/Idh/MocA family protein [Aquipuribacter hungaricus]|uniref:Gfo/Idh/MocA family protein n=1 Tax=Aquipuribacter hungaricus TaxID=545624 RepID=A0ABV7WIG3_9MICO
MNAPPLRHGIIGTGFMATVHSRAVRRSSGVLSLVAGATPESGQAAAVSLGARAGAADAAELVASPEVDVVHVCTPNNTHAPLVRLALQAGKHVVCEKPLATCPDEAAELAGLAAAAGVVAAVPFVYRFYPTVRHAAAMVARGEAGPLWLLHGSYLQDWLSTPGRSNWRVDAAQGGASRAFGDIGIHWCDLMEFVTGHRITALVARTAVAHPERAGSVVTTEDGASVVFETDRGATGSLVVSQASPGRKNRLEFSFDGTLASLAFDQERPEELWVGGTNGNRTVLRDPAALDPAAAGYAVLPAGHPQGYQDSFDAFVADVSRQVRGDQVPGLPSFADGARAARITDAVLRSARTRTWVEVPA